MQQGAKAVGGASDWQSWGPSCSYPSQPYIAVHTSSAARGLLQVNPGQLWPQPVLRITVIIFSINNGIGGSCQQVSACVHLCLRCQCRLHSCLSVCTAVCTRQPIHISCLVMKQALQLPARAENLVCAHIQSLQSLGQQQPLDPFAIVADEIESISTRLRMTVNSHLADIPVLGSAAGYFFKVSFHVLSCSCCACKDCDIACLCSSRADVHGQRACKCNPPGMRMG